MLINLLLNFEPVSWSKFHDAGQFSTEQGLYLTSLISIFNGEKIPLGQFSTRVRILRYTPFHYLNKTKLLSATPIYTRIIDLDTCTLNYTTAKGLFKTLKKIVFQRSLIKFMCIFGLFSLYSNEYASNRFLILFLVETSSNENATKYKSVLKENCQRSGFFSCARWSDHMFIGRMLIPIYYKRETVLLKHRR